LFVAPELRAVVGEVCNPFDPATNDPDMTLQAILNGKGNNKIYLNSNGKIRR
jgi:hypothetical protein